MAKAKSKTPARRKRAPGPSSRSRSSRKAARAGVDGGLDSKQQSALFRGGSLAQRNAQEGHGPESDVPTEITSAAPPALKEEGRATGPMFDEKPVGGKELNVSTAKRPTKQLIEAGDGPDQPKGPPYKSIEDMEPGSAIVKFPTEIRITTPIAGGSVRTFAGRTEKEAFAVMNEELKQGSPRLLPGALGGEAELKMIETQAKQFDKEALERSKEDLKARGIKAD